MTLLDETLARTRAENRAALVAYWPAGYPNKEQSIKAIETIVAAGADIVEVGLPYSDPVMDGATIQAAAGKALANGIRVSDVFDVVKASVAAGAATVVMTYWNPVERFGVDNFAKSLAEAGASGLITPDMIPDEAEEWSEASNKYGLNRIYLVAPSSTDARLAMTATEASGFVYATAVMGVTGLRTSTSSLAPELVARLREVTDKPIGVGLGVSNGEQAHEVAAFADAVIVGSALINCLLHADDEESGLRALTKLTEELRAGVKRG